jgi:hypothetical protein
MVVARENRDFTASRHAVVPDMKLSSMPQEYTMPRALPCPVPSRSIAGLDRGTRSGARRGHF